MVEHELAGFSDNRAVDQCPVSPGARQGTRSAGVSERRRPVGQFTERANSVGQVPDDLSSAELSRPGQSYGSNPLRLPARRVRALARRVTGIGLS